MVFATSLILLMVATFLFLGWGWAFLRVLGRAPQNWAATVAIGLAAVVFLGGVLNLVRVAYPPAIAAIALVGLILSRFAWRTIKLPPILVMIPILAAISFTIATQLPPSIYNFHDDYQKYFAYPVRMLQTGTVYGSSLSAVGLQTLGAQAFLDSFVTAFLPLIYVNAVDAVFGLLLCLLLAAQFSRNAWLGVLAVILINPQYVNISTLFCGSALMMAMVLVDDAMIVGLLCAALIAMKPIFAVFVGIFLLTRWRTLMRTGLAAAMFLLPWVLVHAPHYWLAVHAHHAAPTSVPGHIDTDKLNIFSLQPLPYGSTAANYTALVAAFIICGAMCWRARSYKGLACCITGVATFFVFIYVLSPIQYGYEHGLRYFVPVAIALAPAVFGLTPASRTVLVVAFIPLAAFAPSLRTRVATAWRTHSGASYSWLAEDPDYMDYNRRVLFGPERTDVEGLQNGIPAGAPILAWVNTPFYLNFQRNPIIDIDTAGIGVPWAELPRAQYLIWDYAGFATPDEEDFSRSALNAGAGERKDSLRTLDFIRRLNGMVERGEVLSDDGEVRVVRLFPDRQSREECMGFRGLRCGFKAPPLLESRRPPVEGRGETIGTDRSVHAAPGS